MIHKEISSATGRRRDADGYKLNECGKVKALFPLYGEIHYNCAPASVWFNLWNICKTFFTSLKSIDTSCKSSVKIFKRTAMLKRLQKFRNKEFYLLKILSQRCNSDRPYNHVNTDVVSHQNKLDVVARSYFVKLIDPPTSSSPPKYHCLRKAHISMTQMLAHNKLFSERKILRDNQWERLGFNF